MITISDLNEILEKHFTIDYPECDQDYSVLLTDIYAMNISAYEYLDNILDLHLADAILQDKREIRNFELQKEKIEALLSSPYIVRSIRKCFELHFGIEWMQYRSNNLPSPLIKSFRNLIPHKLEYVRQTYTDEKPPQYIYKYVTATTAISILTSGKLRFNSPLNFNDIRDIQIDPLLPDNKLELLAIIKKRRLDIVFGEEMPPGDNKDVNYILQKLVREIKAPTTTPEKFLQRHIDCDKKIAESIIIEHNNIVKYWRHFVRYFRVLCMSDLNNSPYMWDKYGDKCAGVMLAFDTQILNAPYFHWTKVQYPKVLPRLVESEEIIDNIFGLTKLDKIERVSRLCFLKETKWSQESEWRSVMLRSDWEHDPLKMNNNEDLFDDVTFPIESLSAVQLGYQFTKELKAKTFQIVEYKYPKTKIVEFRKDLCK